jgi:aminoglycoside phosphotransferase (APT) family kinase protein
LSLVHPGQLSVSAGLASRLIAAQFPQWEQLPVRALAATGTVNAVFRVGDRLSARFPLQPDDPDTVRLQLEAEAAAASTLLGQTRFPTPEPVALGEPGEGYPLAWSMQTWIPGTVATDDDPGASAAFAEDLAEFILGVRAIDTHGRAFAGAGRGGDLQESDAWMQTCFARSEAALDVEPLRRLWSELRTLPRDARPDVMNHGDLIPGNVLVAAGRLAGVLDVGGLEPADPALDLVAAWHLLQDGPRRVLRTALACDDLDWAHGRAWAFQQAMGLVWYYATTNPTMSELGRRTLQRITAAR